MIMLTIMLWKLKKEKAQRLRRRRETQTPKMANSIRSKRRALSTMLARILRRSLDSNAKARAVVFRLAKPSYADADAAFRGDSQEVFWRRRWSWKRRFLDSVFYWPEYGWSDSEERAKLRTQQAEPECFRLRVHRNHRTQSRHGDLRRKKKMSFLIRICGGLDPYLLQIVQSKSGFVVQEANGLQSFAGRGDSFESFCK